MQITNLMTLRRTVLSVSSRQMDAFAARPGFTLQCPTIDFIRCMAQMLSRDRIRPEETLRFLESTLGPQGQEPRGLACACPRGWRARGHQASEACRLLGHRGPSERACAHSCSPVSEVRSRRASEERSRRPRTPCYSRRRGPFILSQSKPGSRPLVAA